MKKFTLAVVTFFILTQFSISQVVTQGGFSASELIQDTLITGCVTASNITTNSSNAYGYFSNESPYFPFESGLIMASGDIANAEGPDNATSQGSSIGSGSDPDLAQLTPYTVNDATVIEFDFVPASDTISFNYIFGSEEFPEFANSSYNDVFGFFISGPGINGPYTNNAINIALLPNGQPVTIDNVFNSGIYYVGSPSGSGGEGLAYNNTVQYDGCSIELTAEAIVQACQTYHIKLAVGDAGDSSYDTGVFIEAGSFTSGVQINTVNHSDVGTEADLYEGCTNFFVIERSVNSPIEEEVVIYIDYGDGSTAIENEDVSQIVDSAYMAPFVESDTIWYTGFNDGIEEGTETMILEFWTSCPCGNAGGGNVVVDTIYLYDAEGIKGGIQDVQTNYCGVDPPPTLDIVAQVNITPAFYEWSNGSNNDTITIVPTPGATTYSVTISDQCGNEVYDEVVIRVSSMTLTGIDETPVSCYNECDGQLMINVENDFAPFTYTYGNAAFFYIPDSLTTTYEPHITGLCPKDYYVKIEDNIGCTIETTANVPNKPNILLSDGIMTTQTEYCGGPSEITLTASAIIPDAQFTWFNNTNNESVTFTPYLGEHDYAVSISDVCGNEFVDDITISVSDISATGYADPDINGQCNGQAWVIPNNGIPPYTFYWIAPIADFGQYQEELCEGTYSVIITDAIGCDHEMSVDVPLIVNINNDENNSISIYPNPTKSHANIDLSGIQTNAAEIRILDITGKTLKVFQTTEKQFQTPELSAGTYFIEIYIHGKHILKDKLIITE